MPDAADRMACEDDRLMVRLQEGDSAAFDELVRRHQSALLGFFFRNTHDVQFAEDLTQETLLRIYNQSWDYLPVGRFKGWMFRLARNLLIDNVRRQSHDALIRAASASGDDDPMAQIPEDLVPPEIQAGHRELASLVNDLLQKLPEEQRLAFTLHHYAGLPLAEVAEILECSHATCKSRLRLAREKLQDALRPLGIHTEMLNGD
jgi:RNA polymerase sigma-70 factor (ECF subfamily)